MRLRRLLYLGPQGMAAYHWLGGTLSREAVFPSTESGVQEFAAHLAQHSRATFALLVNAADEGFQVETIPYLRGADRRRVIERRIAQTFLDPPLGAAVSLGHEKTRRKDERLLLAALGNPVFFQPWLNALRAAKVALSGIHSLPFVASALLRKLRVPPEPCLLLSVQDQSLRQSFYHHGGLRFSRLTLLPHGDFDAIAQGFSAEADKLRQYLVSQGLLENGAPIVAHLLAHPDAFAAIRGVCAGTPTLRFNVLDLADCARRLGLKTVPRDTRADGLFLHLLATRPPGVQFAGDDLRHGFRIARLRSLLLGVGAAILAVCLLLSGVSLFDAHRIARETAALREEAALARRQYDDVVRTFPSVPIDNETLGKVIDRYLVEEKRGTLPIGLYREISRALQAEAAVEIDRLDWTGAGSGDMASEGAGATAENTESIVVRGRLRLGVKATPRQRLAAFDRFVEALRAGEKLRVEVLQPPLDIASGTALRADISPEEEEKPREFELRVIREIEP